MAVHELTEYLESIAPIQLQEAYDNSGLIVGNPAMEIKGVLCSLDCTEAVIQEAIDLKCNVVVSHHPILFYGLKKINGSHYVEKALIKAIKNDIALYAIHTNLDNVLTHGVNEKIAQRIGLKNLEILKPKDNQMMIGSGVLGEFKKPVGSYDFLDSLKVRMQCHTIRHSAIIKPMVQRIAICGGAGSFLIREAISKGADLFLTADLKYHEFFESNDQIILADIGHFESEQFTIELLYGLISQKFRNFATHCTKINTNPIQYY